MNGAQVPADDLIKATHITGGWFGFGNTEFMTAK
jgi:hypothetical protein